MARSCLHGGDKPRRSLVVLLMLAGLPCPAPACSLCNGIYSGLQKTLRQDWDRAKVVLYGTVANPRFTVGKAGAGSTDFLIERVLKTDPFLGTTKVITLDRYIPVLDPKNPPKFVVFCDIFQNKLDPYSGRSVRSDAVLSYLRGVQALQGKKRPDALRFYFGYLDHEDDTLAMDAFLEFALSSDADIGQVARDLAPDKLRRLVQDPKTSSERLSLFAFLLGACGNDQDAKLLRALIDDPSERTVKALDGTLGGYINMQPRQGWDLAQKILADSKKPFPERYAVVRALRFYYGWKPAECKPEVLRGLSVLLDDGEMADLAVEDLRRWKIDDLTGKVLAQFGKASHNSPIIRRAIVRYALCCSLPEARQFVAAVRRQDAELVSDIEETLQFEMK